MDPQTPNAPTPPTPAPTDPPTSPVPEPTAPPQNSSNPTPPKKNTMIWIVVALVILVAAIGTIALVFTLNNSSQNTNTPITPTPVDQTTQPITPDPTASSSAVGTVSGQVCYPSNMVPAGIITAKNINTQEEFTSEYAGTENGDTTTYTFELAPAQYNLKFTPENATTNKDEAFYTNYSLCLDDSTLPQCSGTATRPLLTATVTEGEELTGVNLCDYYYPPDNPPQF